jgi:hypothetical protein
LISGSFALYLLLGGLAISLNRSSMYSLMCGAVLAARALSYLLYPNGDERYTAVLFVLIPVSLVIGVSSKTSAQSESQGRQAVHITGEPLLQVAGSSHVTQRP